MRGSENRRGVVPGERNGVGVRSVGVAGSVPTVRVVRPLSGPVVTDTLIAPKYRRRPPMAKTPRMEQIEAMLADDPDDAFLRYGLAMEHSGQGDDETAVNVLRDLITRMAAAP